MGLSKLKIELIKSNKSRLSTFYRRKASLEKMCRELSTLCGIKVCMITYGLGAKTPELWPPSYNNNKDINELIQDYKSQSIHDRKRRTVDSSHYVNERQKKGEALVERTRKENGVAKYPSWDYRYDLLSEEHLRNFVNYLDGKIKDGKARIAQLKDTRTKIDESKILEPSELFLNSYENEHSKMLELSDSYGNDQPNMMEVSGAFLNSYDKDHSKKLKLFGTFLNSYDNDQTKILEPSEPFLISYDNDHSEKLKLFGTFLNSCDNDQTKMSEPSETFLNSYDKDHSKKLKLFGTFLNSCDNDQTKMSEPSETFLNSYDNDHSEKFKLFGTFLNSCDNDQTKMLEPSETLLNSYDNDHSDSEMLEPSGSFLNSYDNNQSKMLEPSSSFLNSYDNPPSTTYASQVSNRELGDLSYWNDRQEEVGTLPFNNPPLVNPTTMNNNDDEFCGPSIMYVPVQVCYLPSAAMPIQLMPHQYVPYTLPAAQLPHSQPNVWYQASNFQMNN